MHYNTFNSKYTSGKMTSPFRGANLYETQFRREQDNHGSKLPNNSIFSGSMSASYSTITPATSQIDSNTFYHGQYHGYGTRDSRLEIGQSEFMRPTNLKYGEQRF